MSKIAALLLTLVLAVPCFAGGYVDAPLVDKIVPPDSPMPSPPIDNPAPTVLVEKVVEKLPPKPAPCRGLAIGLHGNYPTVAFVGTDLEIEAGYTLRFSDQSAMIRGAGVAWGSLDRWTLLKAGFAVFPGNGPAWGVYGELEQFLTPCVSISGAIYPVKSGNGQTIVGDGIVSARAYF